MTTTFSSLRPAGIFRKERNDFSQKFLDTLPAIDGFMLKNKSPTQEPGDVKVYHSAGKSAPVGMTPGFFAREIIKKVPDPPS